MNAKKLTSELRLNHWAQIIQDRITSGQSIKDYCKGASLRESVYYYWQKKLREAACEKLIESTIKNEEIVPVSKNQITPPSGWSLCTVEEAPRAPRQENNLTIEIGKCRLVVTPETSQELLTKTCRVLLSL